MFIEVEGHLIHIPPSVEAEGADAIEAYVADALDQIHASAPDVFAALDTEE